MTWKVMTMPPSEQIEYEMSRILSSPEFGSTKDYLGEMIAKWLSKLFESLSISGGTADFSALIVFTVTVFLLSIVIIFAVAKVLRLFGPSSHSSRIDSKSYANVFTAEDALERSGEEAKAGNFTAAVRWLFINILFILDEKNYIKIHESKTNRQYLNELKYNNFPQRDLFRDLILKFNRIRYGGEQATKEDYLLWLDAAESFSICSTESISKESEGGDRYQKK